MSGSRPEYSRRTFHHGHALHPPAPVHYCPPTRHILDVFNDNIVGRRWGLAALATSSSLCGAAIVLALIFIGDAPHRFGPPFWTLGTIVIAYLICALPISTYTIAVCQRRALGWLGGPTPMTQPQLRATLRLPRTICTVIAALWSIGGIAVSVPAFALLAQPDALSTTATIGLGGLGTIGYTFVFVERAMRPVMAHAVQKMPTGRSEPQLSVASRLLLVWALSTALPLTAAIVLLNAPSATATNRIASATAMASVALVAGIAAELALSRAVAHPLRQLRRSVDAIAHGNHTTHVTVDDSSEIGVLQNSVNQLADALREQQRLRDILNRHVGLGVARRALATGELLSGEIHDITAVFVDVRESTALGALPPELGHRG